MSDPRLYIKLALDAASDDDYPTALAYDALADLFEDLDRITRLAIERAVDPQALSDEAEKLRERYQLGER